MGNHPASDGTRTNAADRQHDFDWEFGTWHTTVRTLVNPLSDAPQEWREFEGTSEVRPLLGGRANVVELSVSGPTGLVEGLNLRLYEPQTRSWCLTFASLGDGATDPGVHGAFDGAVGTFYGADVLCGESVGVRFVIERDGPRRATFEQAFSADGGATWQTNWLAVDTLMEPAR